MITKRGNKGKLSQASLEAGKRNMLLGRISSFYHNTLQLQEELSDDPAYRRAHGQEVYTALTDVTFRANILAKCTELLLRDYKELIEACKRNTVIERSWKKAREEQVKLLKAQCADSKKD